MDILQSNERGSIIVWLYHLDSYETFWKKLDDNYKTMLRAFFSKSWKHTPPTKQQLFTSHLINHPSKTNKICYRSKDELLGRIVRES